MIGKDLVPAEIVVENNGKQRVDLSRTLGIKPDADIRREAVKLRVIQGGANIDENVVRAAGVNQAMLVDQMRKVANALEVEEDVVIMALSANVDQDKILRELSGLFNVSEEATLVNLTRAGIVSTDHRQAGQRFVFLDTCFRNGNLFDKNLNAFISLQKRVSGKTSLDVTGAMIENVILRAINREKFLQYFEFGGHRSRRDILLKLRKYEVSADLVTTGAFEQLLREDRAMTAKAKTAEYGGIDFNPKLFDLEIKRDGKGVALPVDQQPLDQIKVDGFIPIIINITPIENLPLLLGFNTSSPPQTASR